MQTSLKIIFSIISSGFIVCSAFADSDVDLTICNALNYDSSIYPNGHRIIYTLAPLDLKDVDLITGYLSSTITQHHAPVIPSCKYIQFFTKQNYPILSNLIITDEETGIVLWGGKLLTKSKGSNSYIKNNSYTELGTKEEVITIDTTPSQITLKST